MARAYPSGAYIPNPGFVSVITRSAPNPPSWSAARTRPAARRTRQPSRPGHHLLRDLADGAAALLEHREHVAHSTFASSRSSRTSSGTAAAPSPTILPAWRSAGRASDRPSSAPAPGAVGFTSSGFFFAAMIPLSAG